MSILSRETQYIRKWRLKALRGDSTAMSNVAAAYRILRRFSCAARWYRKAAATGDGDAMTDWAYCLHYGMGVRRDERAAEVMYRSAVRSRFITELSREESMYQLAVLLLARQTPGSRRSAMRLLRRAGADGDYPQAARLLQQVAVGERGPLCGCRRALRPGLAKTHCPAHCSRSRRNSWA